MAYTPFCFSCFFFGDDYVLCDLICIRIGCYDDTDWIWHLSNWLPRPSKPGEREGQVLSQPRRTSQICNWA